MPQGNAKPTPPLSVFKPTPPTLKDKIMAPGPKYSPSAPAPKTSGVTFGSSSATMWAKPNPDTKISGTVHTNGYVEAKFQTKY